MKVGMSKVGKENDLLETVKSATKSPYVVIGVPFFVIALVLYLYVLTRLPLSVAYPIMVSAAIAIVAFASHCLFNETITIGRIGGFAAIICGIWLIAR
jgi:multidrug transporter EmrE-like cation transporter